MILLALFLQAILDIVAIVGFSLVLEPLWGIKEFLVRTLYSKLFVLTSNSTQLFVVDFYSYRGCVESCKWSFGSCRNLCCNTKLYIHVSAIINMHIYIIMTVFVNTGYVDIHTHIH